MTSDARRGEPRVIASTVGWSVLTLGLGLAGALAWALLNGRSASASQGLSIVDLLAGLAPVVGVAAARALVDRRRRSLLHSALSSVVPPELVGEMLEGQRGRGGSEQRTITVLFADLEDFSGFSEHNPPEHVARVVTEYLSAMSSVIAASGGTVDKFIGDAIMGIWNAPQHDPEHARRACAAALEMQRRLAELNGRWRADGLPVQRMRIGINTGSATVGYVGGPERLAYTAIGTTVNLGARLEGLNRHYGTSICVAESTVALLDAGGPSTRFLGRGRVKGQSEPVDVYELVGDTSDQQRTERPARFDRVAPVRAARCLRVVRSGQAHDALRGPGRTTVLRRQKSSYSTRS